MQAATTPTPSLLGQLAQPSAQTLVRSFTSAYFDALWR
jgi:hypothetical protein